MKIDKTFLNTSLPSVIKKFEPNKFNTLSKSDRQKLVFELANIISNSLNVKLNIKNIEFIDKTKLDPKAALFNFYNDKILLNNILLNKKLNEYEIASFLDNIIHETIHYCQKQNKIYIEDLKITLPFPYNTLQKHESNAYSLTNDILNICKQHLSNNISLIIDCAAQLTQRMESNCINDLSNRGYDTTPSEIEIQISSMMLFYEDVSQLKSLKENNEFTIKIKKGKQSIDVVKIDNKLMGIINVKEKDGINSLYFTINKNTCYINEIFKENKSKQLVPMSEENKLILIDLLNKIIDIGNKGNYINCTQIEINPISTTATKTEHDKFVNDIKNGRIKISLESKISENQIKKKIFEDIDR